MRMDEYVCVYWIKWNNGNNQHTNTPVLWFEIFPLHDQKFGNTLFQVSSLMILAVNNNQQSVSSSSCFISQQFFFFDLGLQKRYTREWETKCNFAAWIFFFYKTEVTSNQTLKKFSIIIKAHFLSFSKLLLNLRENFYVLLFFQAKTNQNRS